mgnify:FL=1
MEPKFITIHCSATKPKHNFSLEKLRNLHVNKNGWSDIGYHFYITTDGRLHFCRPLSRNGAHVKDFNTDNIGVCLEGGLNNDTGRTDDTYNSGQMLTLNIIVKHLQKSHEIDDENVKGHRDWFGDANGDGVINNQDWLRVCPCFNVGDWMARVKL